MYDLITGLPIHPLVVHFVVVLLPLAAAGLMAVILIPKFRGKVQNILILLGMLSGTAAAYVTVQSGYQLANHVGTPEKHQTYGEWTFYVGIALTVVAVIWIYANDKGIKGIKLAAAILSFALGFAAMILVSLAGHTGADAAWANKMAALTAPVPTHTAPAADESPYSANNVAAHASPTDCWTIVNGNVYDVTKWIPSHPGGSTVIINMCGKDGSVGFNSQHGGNAGAEAILKSYLLGPLNGPAADASASPSPDASGSTTDYTAAGVAKHATKDDCWTIVNGNVYDVTKWIPGHPGGPEVIIAMCGTDGTAMYDGQHAGDAAAKATLDGFLLGPVSTGGPAPAASASPAPTDSAAASASPAPTDSAAASGGSEYSPEAVAAHSTEKDCWSIVNGNVYDLTSWIPQHPGGPQVIVAMCGTDGTAMYEGQHTGDTAAQSVLDGFLLAPVG